MDGPLFTGRSEMCGSEKNVGLALPTFWYFSLQLNAVGSNEISDEAV